MNNFIGSTLRGIRKTVKQKVIGWLGILTSLGGKRRDTGTFGHNGALLGERIRLHVDPKKVCGASKLFVIRRYVAGVF
ncbi:MAG: hypothetical protein HUU55_04680 [Myxococcales bacterium]|nr:hypothetical protein [Myxococcales bacterium]